MFFSGISDEAGASIETQIKAHKELRWKHLELRKVDGQGILSLGDREFGAVFRALKDANMKVSCLGSPIGDWSHSIRDSFLADANLMRRAVKRARQLAELGMLPFVRVMSYPNDKNDPMPKELWQERAITRMRGLLKIVEDSDVILAHENCSGWGGITIENNVALFETIDSQANRPAIRALRVLFDTGNPPTYGYNSWEWYQLVKPWIAYVHIKDAKKVDGEDVYTYPGEGDGCVRQILADLLERGYDGFVSIEPHLEAVIHTGQEASSKQAAYDSYVEYGRRLMRIIEEIKATA